MNTSIIPNVVSSRDIQRNYRKIFDGVKKNRKPVVVLTNNIPDVAIVDLVEMDELYRKAEKGELVEAMETIGIYNKEKKSQNLKILKSLKDLV